ncbi:MAG: FAD-binding oxidoreductase [Solirubrobacteraceae bacterium]
MAEPLAPTTIADAARGLAALTAEGAAVRIRGGGTKLLWGNRLAREHVELSVAGLDRTIEHNVGDLTAGFQAGVPLARIQQELAAHGQQLALDPPLGVASERAATLGGVLATGDSGPLRHRYGGPRDLVLGVTVALSDGTIARSGGKVIKNVAGYDLAKLFTGSFGTLGLILSANVRLHPLPERTVTALAACDHRDTLAAAARALAAAPLELEAFDVAWRGGRGGLLAQVAGDEAVRRAGRVAVLLREHGLVHVDVAGDDAALWERQRAGQRSAQRTLVRVAARPSSLARILEATDAASGTLVGRAALGINYVELDADAIETFYRALPQDTMPVIQDAQPRLRDSVDPWGPPLGPPLVDLMRRLKQQFDPAGACNPGVFVGGL